MSGIDKIWDSWRAIAWLARLHRCEYTGYNICQKSSEPDYAFPPKVQQALDAITEYAQNDPVCLACIEKNNNADSNYASKEGARNKRLRKQLRLIYRKICKDHLHTNSRQEAELMAQRAGLMYPWSWIKEKNIDE